jgi:hypothetical protein
MANHIKLQEHVVFKFVFELFELIGELELGYYFYSCYEF